MSTNNILSKIHQEIEKRMLICDGVFERDSDTYYQGKAVAYQETLSLIDSLQQERPELPKIEIAEYYYHKGVYEGLSQGRADALKILDEFMKRKADPVIVIKQQEQPSNVEESAVPKQELSPVNYPLSAVMEEETSYDTQQYTPRPSVDIGDVARVQFAAHAKVFDKKRKAVFDWEQFKEVVGIFYGFGKKDSLKTEEKEQPSEDFEEEVDRYVREQWDMLTSTDSTKSIVRRIARHFANWQKAQMLKDAVEGYVNYYEDGGGKLMAEAQVGCPYHIGDKVKIVIVKEDKK